MPAPIAKAANAPYFTMTLIAPTSNPARRQWAQIIQNSYVSAGIDAHLVYESFTQWLNTLFGNTTCPAGTSFAPGGDNCPAGSFSSGGWDAGFVGNGGGTVLPDFGTQAVVFYRGDNANDFPPIGQNYDWWINSTYNALAAQYGSTFDPHARLAIAQKMVRIAADQRPGMIIDYPSSVYAFNPNMKPWGTSDAVTQTTAGIDWQHWQTGAITTVNVGLTGDLDAVNPLPTAAQNSLYDRYLYGPTNGAAQSGAGAMQEADARGTGLYINAIANSVVDSPDHLKYTVSFKAHTFQDGVAVTADDYLFTTMASVITSVGYVAQGTVVTLLGNSYEFHYLNSTVDYVNNGAYQHGGPAPAGWNASSVWTSINATAFSLTLPHPYLFTNPLLTGGGALPMHILEQVPFGSWSTSPLSGFTSGCANGALWNTCAQGGISDHNFKVTWNKARYGGNGSYIAYGPVGDGAYVYHGYDSTTQTGTLVKYTGYWNASGLATLHEFTVGVVHVTHITAKDAAIAAYGTGPGAINYLDSQYSFNRDDAKAMAGLGAHVAYSNDPANGWQEMPLNDANPVWGTGAATPLGISHPNEASFAAKEVRTALSYLIPREEIVNSLLQGLGTPGITQFFPTQGILSPGDIYQGITVDQFSLQTALSYLAAAGYDTGYAPPSQGGGLINVPPITVGSINLNVPSFFLGNSLVASGSFPLIPSHTNTVASFYITLQQSFDNGTTWAPVALGSSSSGGYYSITYTPTATGHQWYRVFFTGIPIQYSDGTLGPLSKDTVPGPGFVESFVAPLASHSPVCGQFAGTTQCQANKTDTLYSTATALNVGSQSDLFGQLASGINHALSGLANSTQNAISAVNTNIGTLQTSVNGLESSSAKASDVSALTAQVNNLSSQVSTLTTIAYAALAVAVILGLLAIVLSRRKPS